MPARRSILSCLISAISSGDGLSTFACQGSTLQNTSSVSGPWEFVANFSVHICFSYTCQKYFCPHIGPTIIVWWLDYIALFRVAEGKDIF